MRSMETRFLTSSENDRWNLFVDQSPQGDVFCYYWWLHTVTKGDFEILIVEENGRIVAGMALPFYSSGKINQPYLTRTFGALYIKPGLESARERVSRERRWLNALLDRVDINNVIQIITHHNFTDCLPFLWRGYRQTTRYTYLIDFTDKTVDDIWRGISDRQKRGVRKALKNNLVFEEGDSIDEAYAFSCLSFERQNKVFPYSLSDLRLLDEAVKKHGRRAILRVVDSNKQIHAVNYVVSNQRSAYHLLSGGDPRLRSLGGHTFLLWETIKYYRDKTSVFNFGGSVIQPIEEHYRSFGGIQKQYFQIYNEAAKKSPGTLRYHARESYMILRRRFKKLSTLLNRAPLRRWLRKKGK